VVCPPASHDGLPISISGSIRPLKRSGISTPINRVAKALTVSGLANSASQNISENAQLIGRAQEIKKRGDVLSRPTQDRRSGRMRPAATQDDFPHGLVWNRPKSGILRRPNKPVMYSSGCGNIQSGKTEKPCARVRPSAQARIST
jgi:hypothetical protein